MSSNEVTQEIKRRLDIGEVISQYVRLKKRGKNLLGLCPFHQEKTPSFTVRPDEGFFKCFGCGKGGDVFSFVQEVTGRSFPEVLEELADKAGVTLPKRQQMSEADQARFKAQRERFDVMSQTQKFYQTLLWSPKGQRGLRYLIETRKLPKKIIETFGLGYGGHFGDPPLVRYFEQEKFKNELGVTLGVLRQGEKGLFGMYENQIPFPFATPTEGLSGLAGETLRAAKSARRNTSTAPKRRCTKKQNTCLTFIGSYLDEKGAPAVPGGGLPRRRRAPSGGMPHGGRPMRHAVDGGAGQITAPLHRPSHSVHGC